jgi:DnaK suppressor protein
MASKKAKKEKAKKTAKKTRRIPARKIRQKPKPKPSKKKKIAIKKPAAKKVPRKPKPKPPRKKRVVSKRPAGKKLPRKIKLEHAKGKKPPVRISIPKKPASKVSEEERKAILRRGLINKREEIVREAKAEISKYIKGETRQLVDTALDDGDWAVFDLSEDISLKQLSTHRENLLKIDESLIKLAEGTYGRCEECGEEISEERLKVVPFAIYCRDCQEKKEQLEEIEKKEGLL